MCALNDQLQRAAVRHTGWDWVVEADKAGWASSAPGSILDLLLHDGSSTPGSLAIYVTYLTSYEGMGAASILCIRGCVCGPMTLNARVSERQSLHKTAPALLGSASAAGGACELRVDD